MSENEFKELIKNLNDLKITQESGDWLEDIPNEYYEKYFKKGDFKEVAFNLDVNKRRWYETSITVYSLNGYLFAVRSITNLYNENGDWMSCYYTLEFSEAEAFTTISYKIKNTNK